MSTIMLKRVGMFIPIILWECLKFKVGRRCECGLRSLANSSCRRPFSAFLLRPYRVIHQAGRDFSLSRSGDRPTDPPPPTKWFLALLPCLVARWQPLRAINWLR